MQNFFSSLSVRVQAFQHSSGEELRKIVVSRLSGLFSVKNRTGYALQIVLLCRHFDSYCIFSSSVISCLQSFRASVLRLQGGGKATLRNPELISLVNCFPSGPAMTGVERKEL